MKENNFREIFLKNKFPRILFSKVLVQHPVLRNADGLARHLCGGKSVDVPEA
jgi:hypothetical protein